MTPLIFSGAALAISGVAAVTDLKSGRVPNWLTLPSISLGLVLHGFEGIPALANAAIGCAVVGGLPAAFHRLSKGNAIGGGDVKLFAAIGALLGPTTGLEIEFSAFLLLAVFALVRLAFLGRLLPVLADSVRLLIGPLLPAGLRRPVHPEVLTEMRMGPAIALAVVTIGVVDRAREWVPWLI